MTRACIPLLCVSTDSNITWWTDGDPVGLEASGSSLSGVGQLKKT